MMRIINAGLSKKENMKVKIEVTQIVILTGSGTDKILLHTTLPEGVYPYTGNGYMTIDAARGTGYAYAKKHFPGIEPDVVNTK